jgi:hypothetical protein
MNLNSVSEPAVSPGQMQGLTALQLRGKKGNAQKKKYLIVTGQPIRA